jgi:hypothetical protein
MSGPGRGAVAGAVLSALIAGSPAIGAQTFSVSKDDYKLDTGIAVYFEDSKQTPHVFSADGAPMQMLMCKATLDANIAKIIRAVKALPEFKGRKVVGTKCMRTGKKPIDLYP